MYGRLFEQLEFPDWRELAALLYQLRSGRPPRSPAHTRARTDTRYARETFSAAVAKIDAWRRDYEFLVERLRDAAGRRLTEAVGEVCQPRGPQGFYVWNAEGE